MPAIWKATGGFERQADAVGSRRAPALALKHKPGPGRVAQLSVEEWSRIDHEGNKDPKTLLVLRFFADWLRAT